MENNFKVRSESESIKTSRHTGDFYNHSLPRGEYIQTVIGPKLTKNPMQPQPISHKLYDADDSFENSPVQFRSRERFLSTSSESQTGSEDDSPSILTKSPSIFSKFVKGTEQNSDKLEKPLLELSSSEFQKPPEKFYTPVIGKKKMDLYKFTIIQNAAKYNETQETIEEKSIEETKYNNDISRIRNALVETIKEQVEVQRSKTESIKQILASDSSFGQNSNGTAALSVKNLVFGPNVNEKILQRHVTLILRGLNYSVKLLKGPPMSYIESRQIVLKELKKKTTKTLLLDLDETLITSCSKRDGPDRVLIPEGDKNHPIMIKIRPYAKEFLKRMKEHFEILVFTASCSLYAETVVKELDSDKKHISYILDRNFCLETKNGFFIKDLRIIKNRELKNMILVDNLVHSFGFQIENGVPIIEWTGNKNDQELKHLAEYLIEAKKYDDVRQYNREKLRLLEFANAKIEEFEEL